MPDQVHLFVKVHRSVCPSRVASQVKGFTSRLRTGFLAPAVPPVGPMVPAVFRGDGRWCPRRPCASTPARTTAAVAEGTGVVRRALSSSGPIRPARRSRAARLLADHCDLYNAALEERREAWRMRRVSISYGMQSAQLKEIRRADPQGQGRHSFTAQQQTLRRLNAVFAAFYARAKKGKAGYPRFKPYSRFSQAGFVAGDGAKWTPADAGGWARAAFQAVGSLKVRQHRPVPGTVKFLQLKREHRRWYVIVIADTEPHAAPGYRPGCRCRCRGRPVLDHLRRADHRQPEIPGRLGRDDRRPAAAQRTRAPRLGEPQAAAPRPGQGMAQGPQPAPRLPPQNRPRPRGHLRRDRPGKTQHSRDDPPARTEARPEQRRGLLAEHGRREGRAQQSDS